MLLREWSHKLLTYGIQVVISQRQYNMETEWNTNTKLYAVYKIMPLLMTLSNHEGPLAASVLCLKFKFPCEKNNCLIENCSIFDGSNTTSVIW